MITPEIISYIKAERAKNTPDSVIKSNLLANGWTESDIKEVMSPVNLSGVPQPSVQTTDLKAHKNKVIWTTFFVLVIIDVLIIAWFQSVQGTWGLFGISPTSIIIRLIVIYLISAFSARGSSVEEKTYKTVGRTIFKVIAAIILTIIIGIGLFYLYCLFAFGNRGVL